MHQELFDEYFNKHLSDYGYDREQIINKINSSSLEICRKEIGLLHEFYLKHNWLTIDEVGKLSGVVRGLRDACNKLKYNFR
jgi:hypothetical protein